MTRKGIPDGWCSSSLGEHLREPIKNGYSPVCPPHPTGMWTLGLAAVTPGGFDPRGKKPAPANDPRVAANLLVPGDIVVSRANGARERVGLAGLYGGDPPNCSYPDLMMRVRVSDALLPEFLQHHLLSPSGRRYFFDSARGTASMLKINRVMLEALPLLVPPLAEQREIASALTAVDDAIDAGEAVVEELRRLRKGIHLALCAGKLGANRPRRSGRWGEEPIEWNSASLGELVSVVRNPCTPRPGSRYVEIGVRSHGKGVFLKEPVDGSALGAKRVFFVEPGCLVLNIVFAWEGAVAVTTEEHRGTIASHRFPMFHPVEGAADPRFLRHLLLTPPGLRILGVASPGGAGRNRTLNQGLLMRTPIPCPPLHEQQAIADSLDSLDRRIAADLEVLDERRRVKAALADALLSGRVRVRVRDAA